MRVYKGAVMKLFFGLLVLLTSHAFAGLNVGTYNIRNFDYDERARTHTDKPALQNIMNDIKFDLLGVNEINNAPEFEKFIASKFTAYSVRLSTCGGAHGQRLGYVYNKSKLKLLSFTEDLTITNPGTQGSCNTGTRPLAVAYFEEVATGEKFYAIQAHLKAGGNAADMGKRFQQYTILENFVKDLVAKGNKQIMVTGDFNTTGYSLRDSDYTKFTAMVRNAGLIDLSANVGCTAYWWGGTDDNIDEASVLDHILVTNDFLKNKQAKTQTHGHCKQLSCRSASPQELGVSYEGVSDHCPQTAQAR
jgi:endonuclease/exonuclease/phosphatase family metal-dependent hydrolase